MNTHLLSCHEAEEQFKAAIVQAGFNPPPIVAGKFIRFAGLNKPSHNRSAWCHLFDDYQAGVFGDWSTGYQETWRANHHQALSQEEKRQYAKQAQAAREQAEKDRQAKQQLVAKQAQELWRSLPQANKDHPYLLTKQIPPKHARQKGNTLALAMINQHKVVINMQFISPDGQKWFMTGGKKKGTFIPVHGRIDQAKEVIICEGWATGVTLSLYKSEACIIAAIDCGNLITVSRIIRVYWPETHIIIAGDDDREKAVNAGRKAALEAAAATGASIIFPQFPNNAPLKLSDFNDLHCLKESAA